jgi:alcohol dehydrogenase class IV
VHGFAGVIGGMFDGPHGAICARLLPVVMAANIRALQARDPSNLNLRRYREVAVMLTGKANAQALDGVHWLEELLQTFSIPMLSSYGLKSSDIQEVAEKSSRSSSMAGNPIQLTPDELYEILALVV